MINKRGFTLVEIIICVSLIAIISTISIVIFTKNKDYSNLTKKILEAANVYIATEKDDQGNTYEYGINNGGKGVRINVNELVNKGYIDEKLYKTLEKEYKLEDDESYLVWVTNSIKGSSEKECGTNAHEYKVNWEKREDNVVYLCPYNKKSNEQQITIKELMNNAKIKVDLEKIPVSEDYCKNHADLKCDQEDSKYTTKENGIFLLYEEESNKVYYYYRGSVNNNYLELGKNNENNSLLWRIIWINDDNKAKLVLDDEIQLTLKNKNGNTLSVNLGDEIFNYDTNNRHHDKYYIFNPTYSKLQEGNTLNITMTYKNENLLEKYFYYNSITNDIFYENLVNWYATTDLKKYEITDSNLTGTITTKDNFCINSSEYKIDSLEKTVVNKTFECTSSSTYSSPIGYLNYGDVLRVGTFDINEAGGYLLKNSNNSYPLQDIFEVHNGSNGNYIDETVRIYSFNNSGLTRKLIHSMQRDRVAPDIKNRYTLKDENGNIIAGPTYNHGTGLIVDVFKFNVNSIKPSIIIDLNNKVLTGNGTSDNPYKISNLET